jgi:hypothetical protein
VSIIIKKEESPIVVPQHIPADEEIKEKSEVRSLAYNTLVLAIAEPLVGSRHTVPARPPFATHL